MADYKEEAGSIPAAGNKAVVAGPMPVVPAADNTAAVAGPKPVVPAADSYVAGVSALLPSQSTCRNYRNRVLHR